MHRYWPIYFRAASTNKSKMLYEKSKTNCVSSFAYIRGGTNVLFLAIWKNIIYTILFNIYSFISKAKKKKNVYEHQQYFRKGILHTTVYIMYMQRSRIFQLYRYLVIFLFLVFLYIPFITCLLYKDIEKIIYLRTGKLFLTCIIRTHV